MITIKTAEEKAGQARDGIVVVFRSQQPGDTTLPEGGKMGPGLNSTTKKKPWTQKFLYKYKA